MTWHPTARLTERSDCGRYELRGSYSNGHFAWRGRAVATDELIESSADREYVKGQCARHAEAVDMEAA